MNTNIKVENLMTANVMTINQDDLLYDAIHKMDVECMSVLPVVDTAGRICGILSNSDLVKLTYELQCDVSVLSAVPESVRRTLTDVLAEDNCGTLVKEIMTESVETVPLSATITYAAQLLVNNNIHHLPVVDDIGIPIGIVSAMDVVRAVAFPLFD